MEKIKAFREKAEMSQRDLAQAIGTSQAAVAQWETGATQPTLDNLRKVADILGVSPGDLL
jgi:transcriptional regulator with XRE-family HTH domain